MMFEEVSDGEKVPRLGLTPDSRADPEREYERSEARAAVPPPRRDAFPVRDRRRPNGGAGPDVRREERREDEAGPERAPSDEKIAGPANVAANPRADRDEADRVRDKDDQQCRHGLLDV